MQDMLQNVTDQLTALVGGYLPNLLGALAILIIGWIVALIASAIVRGVLNRTSLDNRLAEWVTGRKEGFPIERYVSKTVFYLVMLFVLVAFFQALRLEIVTQPLNALLIQLAEFAPRLLGGAALLLVAVVLAGLVRKLVTKGLLAAKLDERLGGDVTEEGRMAVPLSKSLGDALYWLIIFLFLPAILAALALEGLLMPVRDMTDQLLGFLPHLLAGGLILLIGWFVATLIRRIVTNLLAAVGVDGLSERVGLERVMGSMRLSGLIGLIVYVLVLIPVLVSALNALQLDAVTRPASDMLGQILEVIPAIFAAALLLTLAYVVGRLVSTLISNLLAGAGFNNALNRLGLRTAATEGTRTPSAMVGTLILAAIMFFAAIEAAELLGFAQLSQLLSSFLVFAGQVVLGLIVFGVGLWLANLAASAVHSSQTAQAALLAPAARISIIVLAAAMALRQMGLANEIINMAFGLLLGSVAVAVAIAFGIGARDLAGRTVEEWAGRLKNARTRGSE